MTPHGRKYGEKVSHPLPLWNGILEHRDRIGEALWEFLWCLDRVTEENDGIGLVYGRRGRGSPVKLAIIVKDLKGDKETTRRHLKKLEALGYIRTRRTPFGQVIEVLNSKKFGIWGKEKPQSAVSLAERNRNSQSVKPQSAVSKEDHAVDHAIEAAVRHCSPTIWEATEVNPNDVPGEFRELCQKLWPTRNGTSVFEFMGICLDGWKALGNDRYPRSFCAAKAKLEKLERAKPGAVALPELEAEPWAK